MVKHWLKIVLLWRLWLVLVVVMASWWVPYRPAFEFTGLPFYQPNLSTWLPSWIWAWSNFDGVIFLQNAAQSLLTEVRFLPLYPFLIKVVSLQWQPGSITWQQIVAGLVIAHLSLVVALKYLRALILLDFSHLVSNRVFWYLLVFPTSFFFVSLYTESLFLLLAIGSFWAARQKQWWISFALVGLASLTRLPGILLLLPIGWEWASQRYTMGRLTLHLSDLGYLVLAMVPLLSLMMLHYQTSGDALAFVHAHGELANSRSTSTLVFPAVTVIRYIKILSSLPITVLEWWVALLELVSAGFLAVIVYWSWRLKLRFSYQLYTIAMAALPILSGTFSGLPRYLVIIFPIYLVLALKLKRYVWIFLAGLVVLQAILLVCFSRGYYIS